MTDVRPDPDQSPLISVRGNGDRLVGERGTNAIELYAAGSPPIHGFAVKRPVAPRVSRVRIGDELRVERRGDEWVALDDEGVLGTLRWLAGDDGRSDVNGLILRFPARGVLRVQRLVVDPTGIVKDVAATSRRANNHDQRDALPSQTSYPRLIG